MKMGSSNSKAKDEDRISDDVRSNADVVVVNLADVSRATWPTNTSLLMGNFPSKHGLSEASSDNGSFAPGSSILVQTTLKPVSFANLVARKYENVVVNFVIGGNISL
ncbi:unnamed protein product [Sphagnum jensenii]|uniref:Uncharacterized protein n=1 Tax=Sphagnum jensenii TaxID=128206 RepID=A0ABP1AMR7_9BRYO